MSEEDEKIRRIVREVIAIERAEAQHDEFYINRREFYDTHTRVKAFFRIMDKISNTVGTFVVYGVVLGLAMLVLLSISGKFPK